MADIQTCNVHNENISLIKDVMGLLIAYEGDKVERTLFNELAELKNTLVHTL